MNCSEPPQFFLFPFSTVDFCIVAHRSNLFYFIDKDDSEGITLDEFEVSWKALNCSPSAFVVTKSMQQFVGNLRYGWQRRTESLTCKLWESKEVRSLPTCASKRVLGADVWMRGDAWTLFKLLDEEACGSISKDAGNRASTKHVGPRHPGRFQIYIFVTKAFVDGCLRLRGSASGPCSVDCLMTYCKPSAA